MNGQPQLRDVVFFLAEPNKTIRSGLMAMLPSQGLRSCKAVTSLAELLEAIQKTPPDFIAVADTFDEDIFQHIRDLRHHKIGVNPFTVITFMVEPDNDTAMKQALLSGADDVMIKPVAPGQIVERAKQIAYNRAPFVATTKYIGPNRSRNANLPTLNVINTLKDKMDGKEVSLGALKAAVDQTLISVRTAQLDSHGTRLGAVCDVILKAYELGKISPKLEDYLLTLVGSLEEAAKTARMIGEGELAEICIDFSRQVEELAEGYQNPAERDLAVIRTLPKAFAMAKGATKGGG
jgi:DNA-binding response OmpR family regulator